MPRKDRTFTHNDLARFACRNFAPEEQAKIICQHMSPSVGC